MKKLRSVLQEFLEHKNFKRITKDNPIITGIIKKLEYRATVADKAGTWLRDHGRSDEEACKESALYVDIIADLEYELEYLDGVIMTEQLADIIRSLYPPYFIERMNLEWFLRIEGKE